MLVAPTEQYFRDIGRTSSLPERYGVDFMFADRGSWYGVQRKEHGDFINSVHDGRLARELAQMGQLATGMLVIEGEGKWTNDGELIGWGRWTREQEHAYLWSVQRRGIWVDRTAGTAGTKVVLRAFERWVHKATHRSTLTRPGAVSTWGRAGSRDWLIHLLCGFDGVGPEIAARVVDQLGCPLAWKVDAKELMAVEGIGKKRAGKLIEALEG